VQLIDVLPDGLGAFDNGNGTFTSPSARSRGSTSGKIRLVTTILVMAAT
jgi:hypothetical protein